MNNLLMMLERRFPAVHNHGEQAQLIHFVETAAASREARILEVGCGFGGNMIALKTAGFSRVMGVDVNPQTVAANLAKGLDCVTADGFDGKDFDIVIMAHVIEHFQPEPLMVFLDRYLDALKPGGVLIVSTPLLWEGFYQDFDHIKPYYPKGLLSIFEQGIVQVQYYGRNRLSLVGHPWVRKMPFLIAGHKYFLIQPFNLFERIVQVGLNLAFYGSRGRIGKPNGWMGVFRKEPGGNQ